jgi:hypothetical protein
MWRIVDENEICKKIYYETKEKAEYVEKNLPNILEISFDPEYSQRKLRNERSSITDREYLLERLMGFINETNNHCNEEYYNHLLKLMVEFDTFRQLWPIAKEKVITESQGDKNMFQGYGIDMNIVPARKPTVKLDCYLFDVKLVKDPRYTVEFHTPVELSSYKYDID